MKPVLSLQQKFEQMPYPEKVKFLEKLFKVHYDNPTTLASQTQVSRFLPKVEVHGRPDRIDEKLRIYAAGQGKFMSATMIEIPPGAIITAHKHEGYETFVYGIRGTVASFTGDHLQNFNLVSAGAGVIRTSECLSPSC